MRKPFDRKLWKQNDQKAKKWFENILPKEFACRENPNRTGVDILIYRKGKLVAYAEVEIKKVWGGGLFPWNSVHLPERKLKYAGHKLPTLFVLFRKDGKRFLCFWDRVLLKSYLVEVKNKFVPEGEEFYDVKIEQRGVYSDITEAFREKFDF